MATADPTPRPRRSTRDRPAKAPLSEDAVVDAALSILGRDGLDAVTMRAVAKELDTGAASLYVYVRNRDELWRRMLDRVALMVEPPAVDPARWRDQLRQLCLDALAALEAHPGIARVALAHIPTGEGALRSTEAMLSMMLAGGIDPQRAAWACDNLWLIITATAVETMIEQEATDQGVIEDFHPEDLRERFERESDRFPVIARHAVELTTGGDEVRFLHAIDTYIDGLLASPRR